MTKSLFLPLVLFHIAHVLSLSGFELEYVGCYNLDWFNDILRYHQHRISHHSSLLDCAADSFCLSEGTFYFSLRYGTCFCSDEAPDLNAKVREHMCDFACMEGFSCGGREAINVYKASVGQGSEETVNVNLIKTLHQFAKKLFDLKSENREKEHLENSLENLMTEIARIESKVGRIQEKIMENSGACSLFGNISDKKEWLQALMEDPDSSVQRISNLLRADVEVSVREAKTQLADARIKSWQDSKEEQENKFKDLENCSR